MTAHDGARGDVRKRAAEAMMRQGPRDRFADVAAEHLWHNIDSGLWWNHEPLANWLAADRAEQRAEALREAADWLDEHPDWTNSDYYAAVLRDRAMRGDA